MTITLNIWAIPIGLTILIAIGTIYAPISKGGGDYNFAPAFDALRNLVLGVGALLIVWLVFFAAMWAAS